MPLLLYYCENDDFLVMLRGASGSKLLAMDTLVACRGWSPNIPVEHTGQITRLLYNSVRHLRVLSPRIQCLVAINWKAGGLPVCCNTVTIPDGRFSTIQQANQYPLVSLLWTWWDRNSNQNKVTQWSLILTAHDIGAHASCLYEIAPLTQRNKQFEWNSIKGTQLYLRNTVF